MADPLVGILGQEAPGPATSVDLYTVPADRRAVCSTLVICETASNLGTIRIHARPGGEAESTSNAIAYGVEIEPNSMVSLTMGITLAESDVVSVRSDVGAVTFTLFGEETDVPE